MNRFLFIVGCSVAVLGAGGAQADNAGVTAHGSFTFVGSAQSPVSPYVLIDDFNSGLPSNVSGPNTIIVAGGTHDSTAADPFNAFPPSDFLATTAGGDGTITLPGTTSVQFDWGSVDTYNTLIVHFTDGTSDSLTGLLVAPPANGEQFNNVENGLFTYTSSGPLIKSVELLTTKNSFEIDNVAVLTLTRSGGTPEPATWTMMILGLGGVGALLRQRRALRSAAA
jgi:hypothetical protein